MAIILGRINLFCIGLFADGSAARKLDLAGMRVNGEYLDDDLLTFLEDVGDIVDVTIGQLGDVAKTFGAFEDFDECTEIHDLGNGSQIDFAGFGFANDAVDHFEGLVDGHTLIGSDRDGTIVLDIDLSTGNCADILDRLAAGTNDFADLAGIDLEGFDSRSIFALLVYWPDLCRQIEEYGKEPK